MIPAWRPQPLDAGLWIAAAVLLFGGFGWREWSLSHAEAGSERRAQAIVQRVAEWERSVLAQQHRFAVFGPTEAELRSALPGFDPGPAMQDFSVDALIDGKGVLHLRAVSRPEAIRDGRVGPVMATADLAGGPPPDTNEPEPKR
ncbi:MAG: hypothetical protein JO209_05605 [Acidisphaera sp.]|nr:hypothetical protein [Acidisphaera sp.]